MTLLNTTAIDITCGALNVQREQGRGWVHFTIGGESFQWDQSHQPAELNEWLSPRGFFAFVAETNHWYLYEWYKKLDLTVEVVGKSEVIRLFENHLGVGSLKSSSDLSKDLVLVSDGRVTVTCRYEDNRNGDRPQGRKSWTVQIWDVKGGMATLKSETDLQAPIDAAARRWFAYDQVQRLIDLGYSRQQAWDIIRVSGPGVVPTAIHMLSVWRGEWSDVSQTLSKVLNRSLDWARMPGESRNDSLADLNNLLLDSGLSVPDVTYGKLFAVVRTAIKMLEISLPDLRPVDAV